jgi:hypothetical protein
MRSTDLGTGWRLWSEAARAPAADVRLTDYRERRFEPQRAGRRIGHYTKFHGRGRAVRLPSIHVQPGGSSRMDQYVVGDEQ